MRIQQKARRRDPCRSMAPSCFCIMAAMLAGCLIISPASANPPTEMLLSYNEQARDLSVVITHPVPDPQVHYIQNVIVSINGKMVNDSRYTRQPTPGTFTYTYPIVTVPGDEIEVTASCVLAGSLSRQFTAGPAGTTSSSAPKSQPTQKAAGGLMPLLGAAAAFLFRKK